MKIAQVVSTFPPYYGGTGNAVFCISRELAALGHEVTVFTPDYGVILNEVKDLLWMRDEANSGEILRSAQNDENGHQDDNYNFKVVRLKPVLKIGNAAWVPQFLWKLRGFDVVHLHAPFIGAELVLKRHFIFNVMPNLFRHLWISKQVRDDNKQRLIVTYHHDLIANDWRKYIFGAWNKVVLPLVARVAEKIIGSSLDYIERSNLGAYCKSRKGKFVEIPFGVDINKFRPLLRQGFERHAQRLGFSAEEKIVLFVGGLDMAHNFKGVEHLIRAAKILKDRSTRFRVLVIGDGDLRPDLERQVANFGLRHVVKFFGNAEDVLPDLYNLACVEVLPSTTMGEAFGLVLLEAMACGKPIIASNLPGVRTVCEDGVNGLLVKPGDAADLAKKLALILSDDELAARLGEAGLQRVKEKYNWKKVAEEHLKVYGS